MRVYEGYGTGHPVYTMAELKTMIWCYYMSYWNNRRICSANDGLPPAVKRALYYQNIKETA